ncbi:MAG: hypothetical protein N2Z67_03645 [Acetobacteraceae bacterium]|nr:hypothetical protein [Acetobacteraceae bacterium]
MREEHSARAIGTIGTIGKACGERSEAARLLRLAAAGAAGLAEPDPDLARERAVIAAARVADAAGEGPVPQPEADHRDHPAGLERAALHRPPSWADVSALPSPGARCSCCSRHRAEAGGRWWRERISPRGWRCWTCHPPDHLEPQAVIEVLT